MSGDKYADAKAAIEHMAAAKMVMNRHKGSIEDVDPQKLIDLLRQEVEELDEAVLSGSMVHIIEEAADIHNFLIGLVQQQIDAYRGRKNVGTPGPHSKQNPTE